jgi:hypothetical protein
VIRFGRIPFKIAKLVLDPSLNQTNSQGDISMSMLNDIDKSVDISNAGVNNSRITNPNISAVN